MKRLIALLALLLILVISFASCQLPLGGVNGGNGENSGEEGEKNNENEKEDENRTLVYGEGLDSNIIVAKGSSLDTTSVATAIFESTDGKVVVGLRDDSAEVKIGEIVIGETTREISTLAKQALDRKIRNEIYSSADEEAAEKDVVGYCVVVADGAVALVWSHDAIEELAFDYLIEEYLDGKTLDSKSSITDAKVLLLSDFYEERETAQRSEEWAKVREDFLAFGCDEEQADECVAALKSFIGIADERVYIWLANLYDPVTGGFYYSNSGRDTEGFLPDIESTFQALNMINSLGLITDFGRDTGERLRNALPKEMQAQIVKFVQSCQSDEDGYFHHPQWAGEDAAWTARLGRDLSWATGIFTWFEAKPLYTLPTNRSVSSEVGLTDRLGGSSVAMVSKVVLTSAVPDYLETPEAWRNHLESLDWAKSSYQTAHTIGSQSNMIRSRGQEYIDILAEVFNEKQNPENGLWEEGIYYASTNGLMKTVAAMNSLGIKLNYAEEAFNSALTMAKFTERDDEGFLANHVVDVYNPWYAMSDIMINAERYGDPETINAIRTTLVSEAKDLILCSMEKTIPFKKDDGSFGYNYDYSPDRSQGAPVAVPGTIEGDVNGCTMAVNGVVGNMLEVFGVHMPRRFFMSDYIAFMDIIENLGPVSKDNVGVEAEVTTFDDEVVGNTEPYAFSSVSIPYGGLAQIEAKDGSENDLVFHIQDNSGTEGTSVRYIPGGLPMGAKRCVVEFDINVKKSTDGVFYQIFFGSTYQLTLTSEGDMVRIGDSSTKGVSNDFGVSFPKNEWHTVRVEYYFTGDRSTTVTKIFLDGALRALSDNFYGKTPDGGKPDLNFAEVHFYTLYGPVVDVYLDNIYACKDKVTYMEEPIVNPNRISDFENSVNGALTPGISSTDYLGSATIGVVDDPFKADDDGADGKVLQFTSQGSALISKKAESFTPDGNAFVFDTDVYFNSASADGALTQTYFKISGGQIFALTFRAGVDEDGEYVELCTLDMSNNTARTPLARINMHEWTNLRVEYYRYQYQVGPDGNLWDGVKVRVLVNGEEQFNGLCDYPDPNALSKPITHLQHYLLSGKSVDMYFDNMIFEIANITYVDADGNEVPDPENPSFPKGSAPIDTPADADHDGKFDFEDVEIGKAVVGGLSIAPNEKEYGNIIEIAEDPNGDKALMLITVPSQKDGNTVIFEADKNAAKDANCQVVEFTANAVKAAGVENYLQLYAYDSKGNIVSSYNILFPKGGKGDMTIGSRLTTESSIPALSANVNYQGGDIKFRFEYYEDNGITKLYVNETFVGEGFSCYHGTGLGNDTVRFRINTLIKSAFELYLDDINVTAIEKAYVAN